LTDRAATHSTYSIDSNDRIVSVDSAWLRFARENGTPELTADSVIGRSLWDFVSGGETRYLYRLVLERVRTDGSSVVLPFRCDSPATRRYMHLKISPLHEGNLEFQAILVSEEQRSPLALLDPDVPRSERILTLCSWCKRARVRESEWVEPETAISRLDLFGLPDLPQLSHGICDRCVTTIEAKSRGREVDPCGS
jgi:hypothetical protein